MSLVWAVEQRRGGVVEAEHRVHACALQLAGDMHGQPLFQVGSDLHTTFRSAAKPFQLASVIALLPASLAAALTSTELALGSASHHGEREHIEALERLLHTLGRTREHLYCGAHEPVAVESARALRGRAPDVLHNNCAGKHAFMAAASAARGYAADYRPAQHPVQQAILRDLEQRVGHTLTSVVDGCGVPCFVLPLSSMARAYAQLALQVARADGSSLARIGQALRAHPRLMSGSDAFDGWLNEHTPVIAKVGAQGLVCLAVPDRALGIAIKIESGVDLARPVACSALLEHLLPGLGPALPERFYVLRNVVGDRVGELVTVQR